MNANWEDFVHFLSKILLISTCYLKSFNDQRLSTIILTRIKILKQKCICCKESQKLRISLGTDFDREKIKQKNRSPSNDLVVE